MPSPAKRRKRNDPEPSGRSTRSIESFFQGQSAKQARKTEEKGDDATGGTGSGRPTPHTGTDADEAFARRLQAQWDQENSAANAISSTAELAPGSVPAEVEKSSTPVSSAPQGIEHTGSPQGKKDTLSLQSSAGSDDAVSSDIPFDQSPLAFDPSQYVEGLAQHWADGAPYALLTRAFALAGGTTSRIKIVDTLVNFLRLLIEGDPSSLIPAVWLATGSISPPYIDLELGLGGSSISKALQKVYGLNSQGLKALYNKHGDPGDVAFEAKKKQSFTLVKPKPLRIKGVYQSLMKIATSKGAGSQDTKQRIIERLLQDARGAEESRYIVRTLVKNLRIGAVKTTMLIALSRAFLFSKPKDAAFSVHSQQALAGTSKEALAETYNNAEEIVKAAYARHPDYNNLVSSLLEVGVSEELLARCGLKLHVPLMPMLGSITRDLSEMLTKLQGRDFTCEYKYDGQRAQVHCDSRGKVSIFSRHLELMTDKYPDLVSLVPQIRGESVSSFILEGEVVAVDQESGELQPFQVLTNRAKKNVDIGTIKINVCLFAFDLMYLNGEPLLDRPFRERRELLRGLFVEVPNRFTWVKSLDATSTDSETVLEFFKNATDTKCEGVMVKVLDNIPAKPANQNNNNNNNRELSQPTQKNMNPNPNTNTRRKALLATYEPDKRLDSWLKVKKDYNATSSETLDLVPIAAWHGQGRKANWWSPILLAVRNPDSGILEAVCKCMSGFTDKFYLAVRQKYDPDSLNAVASSLPTSTSMPGGPGSSSSLYVEYHGETPDVWFHPQEVWEVAFADITLSPTYSAAIGLVSEERGLSLRFPRFLRVREDKSVEEASSSDYLALLWRLQGQGRGVGEGNDDGDGGDGGGGDGESSQSVNDVGFDADGVGLAG